MGQSLLLLLPVPKLEKSRKSGPPLSSSFLHSLFEWRAEGRAADHPSEALGPGELMGGQPHRGPINGLHPLCSTQWFWVAGGLIDVGHTLLA